MRVIFVTKGGVNPKGGAQKAAKDWYVNISKHVECHLLTDQNTSGENIVYPKIDRVPLSYLFDAIWFSRKLAKLCQQIRPNIIHVHSHTGFVIFPPKNIPTIVTFHDEPLFVPYDNISLGFAPVYLTTLHRIEQLLRFLLLKTTPWIHALSTTIRDQLIRMGMDSEKITVIPNGFSEHETKPSRRERTELLNELGLPDDAKLVVTVGSISFRKGIHQILLAAKQLQSLDSRVHFLLIGSMELPLERAYSRALKEKLSKYEIRNVHLLGHIPSILLHDVMSHADSYLSTSLSEACNLALIEAAEYGIPIIATKVGAVKDLFSEEAVLLDKIPSAQELRSAIEINLRPSRKVYSCVSKFSWSKVTRSILSYYSEILHD